MSSVSTLRIADAWYDELAPASFSALSTPQRGGIDLTSSQESRLDSVVHRGQHDCFGIVVFSTVNNYWVKQTSWPWFLARLSQFPTFRSPCQRDNTLTGGAVIVMTRMKISLAIGHVPHGRSGNPTGTCYRRNQTGLDMQAHRLLKASSSSN